MKKGLFFISALFISVFAFGQELMVNGGLEDWADATTVNSYDKAESVTQESTVVHSGTYSAYQVGGTKDIAQTVAVTPGNSYTISLWYNFDTSSGGDGSDIRIWSWWEDASGTALDDNAAELKGPDNGYFTTTGDVWEEYSVTLTAPATAVNFHFEVRTYSGAATYWDDFSVFDNGSATAVSNVTENTFKLYPNPATSQLTVVAENASDITIFNAVGQEVKQVSASGKTTVINIENLNNGLYFVSVNGEKTQRFIKK